MPIKSAADIKLWQIILKDLLHLNYYGSAVAQ